MRALDRMSDLRQNALIKQKAKKGTGGAVQTGEKPKCLGAAFRSTTIVPGRIGS